MRSCYVATIKPFFDSDISCKIRWYWVDEGTPLLPVVSRFCSGNWKGNEEFWTGPGEVAGAPRPWNNGAPPSPRPLGDPAGPLEYFTDGAPVAALGTMGYDALGVPFPCSTTQESIGVDIHSYVQYSTISDKRLYPAGALANGQRVVSAFAGNWYFVPFVNVHRLKVQEMAVYKNEFVAAGFCRMAIYQNSNRNDLSPTTLLFDSDDVPVAGAVAQWVFSPCGVNLDSDTLYWFAFQRTGSSGQYFGISDQTIATAFPLQGVVPIGQPANFSSHRVVAHAFGPFSSVAPTTNLGYLVYPLVFASCVAPDPIP